MAIGMGRQAPEDLNADYFIGRDPAGLYLLKGRACARRSQRRKAEAAFDQAVRRNPEALAGFACLLGLEAPLRQGSMTGSPDATVRRALDRRIKDSPDCWWAYALRGSCRFKDKSGRPGILERAEADLRRALELRPDCGWIHALLAQLLWHDKTAEALKAVDQACRRLPALGWVLAWKAQILAKCGRARQAESLLNRALRLNPEYILARAWRGVLRLRRGGEVSAEEDLLEVLRLRPGHGLSWAALGELRLRQNRLEEALENLSRSVLCEPEAARSLAAGLSKGALAQTSLKLEKFLRRRPGETVARLWLGELYLRRGLHGSVLKNLNRFIAAAAGAGLNPLLGWAYRWRSQAHSQLGRVARSKSDFRASLRLNPALDFFQGC